MAQVTITRINLKGPAGSATNDKRVVISRLNLHGNIDKRVLVSKLTLVAPPPDARVLVSRVRFVGASSPQRPVYYGTSSGWTPIDVYLPINGVWTKVT